MKTLPEAQRTQGIESVTWIIFFSAKMISNWFQSETWFKLYTQYPGSVVPLAMFSTIGHQMVPLALVKFLVTRWRHLHWLQMWSPGGTTCISCKFDQLGEAPCISCKSDDQVALPALVQLWLRSMLGHQAVSLALPHCLGLP